MDTENNPVIHNNNLVLLSEEKLDKEELTSSSSSSVNNSAEDEEDDEHISFNINKKPENSKFLKVKDLKNRYQSKIACLIRKKYTSLMKESIRAKANVKITWYNFFSTISTKLILNITGNIIQAFISLFAVVVYVVRTYYDQDDNSDVSNVLDILEYVVAGLVLTEWSVNFIRAKEKFKFFMDILNILDLFTAVPIFAQLFGLSAGNLGFVRVFKVVRVMRIFRVYKVVLSPNSKDSIEEGRNETSRRLIAAIISVLAMVFLSTGIVHYLNDQFPDIFALNAPIYEKYGCRNSNNTIVEAMSIKRNEVEYSFQCPEGDYLEKIPAKITFDLAFYYMIITMSTVGYGDVYPESSWMRLVIGIFVIFAIVTISKQTSELNNLIKIDSEYQQAFTETNHVIISGFFTKSTMLKFLNEFYHLDHKEKSEDIKIVIIQPNYPDKDFQSILINPKYEENLHYIYGDIFSEQILMKANISQAKAVFLLSAHDQINNVKNDQFIILACKAISQASQAQIYAQLNFTQSLLHDWCDWDIACSTQQIKMSIIVKNGLIPGFSTMIMNLISSSSNYYSSEIKETPWLLEYIHGASQEIYVVKIPEKFDIPIKFHLFVQHAYLEYGSLIIGIKTKKVYHLDSEIYYCSFIMNPLFEYDLKDDDELIIISSDLEAAQTVFNVKSYKRFLNFYERKVQKRTNDFLNRLNKRGAINNVAKFQPNQNNIEENKEVDDIDIKHSFGKNNKSSKSSRIEKSLNSDKEKNINREFEDDYNRVNNIASNKHSYKDNINILKDLKNIDYNNPILNDYITQNLYNSNNNINVIKSHLSDNLKIFNNLEKDENFFSLFKFQNESLVKKKNSQKNINEEINKKFSCFNTDQFNLGKSIIDKTNANEHQLLDNELANKEKAANTNTYITNNNIQANMTQNLLAKQESIQDNDVEEFNIPLIFQNKQHFKIWENNSNEFTKHLQNHFIVFCKEDMLNEFITCFSQHNNSIVFFISDQSPTSKWEIIKKHYVNLVHIECCYSDIEDLMKLNLEKAKHVYILTWAVENSNVKDSGILPLVKLIEENFPNCKYTLELSDELNVRYLSTDNNLYANDVKTLYRDKTVYNEAKRIREKKRKDKNVNEKIPFTMWPKYAKSDIFFSSSLDSLMAFTFHNEGLLDVLTILLGVNNYADEELPENNEITTFRYTGEDKYLYDKVFSKFINLEYPIIPIAVFRREKDEELRNKSHYIITNPKKELMLNKNDEVICIGRPPDNLFENLFIEDEDASHSSNSSGSLLDNSLNEGVLSTHKLSAQKRATEKIKKKIENNDINNLNEEDLIKLIELEISKLKKISATGNKNRDEILNNTPKEEKDVKEVKEEEK